MSTNNRTNKRGREDTISNGTLAKLRSWKDRPSKKQRQQSQQNTNQNNEGDNISFTSETTSISGREEMEEYRDQRLKELRNNSDINNKFEVLLKSICDTKIEAKNTNDRVTECEKRESTLAEIALATNNRLCQIELSLRRKNVLIKGAPFHKEVKNNTENKQQTEYVIQWLLQELDCKIEIASAVRFTPTQRAITHSNSTKKPLTPIIKVELISERDKAKLFAKLAENGKKSSLKGIAVTNDYPPFMKEKLEELEKKAYDIRKSSNNTKKTKILTRGKELILLVDGKEIK